MSSKTFRGKGLPPTATVDFEVKAPFKIMEDNRRRFIRIDIDEPIGFTSIKAAEGTFWPDGDGPDGTGEILNISAGGILMYTESTLMSNTILSMSLSLEGCETINNILGVVKRVEIDSGGYLVGVESITLEKLNDILSQQEVDQLPQGLASFNQKMRALLNNYVFARKLSEQSDEK